jgi:thioredoxin-like negative regulator of GroEL
MQSLDIEIYTILNEIGGFTVYYESPEVIEVFPTVTYIVENNVPQYNLDKDIIKQDVSVKVDIWAETREEAQDILISIEAAMREANYLLAFNQALVDPDGGSHVTTQFIYIY